MHVRSAALIAALLLALPLAACNARPDDLRARASQNALSEQSPAIADESPLGSDPLAPGSADPSIPQVTSDIRELAADVPIDNEGKVTCPATLTLMFIKGGDAADGPLAIASLSATCTDRALMPIDASGRFDGSSFEFKQGQRSWSGTIADGTVTITGGPGNKSYVFPAP